MRPQKPIRIPFATVRSGLLFQLDGRLLFVGGVVHVTTPESTYVYDFDGTPIALPSPRTGTVCIEGINLLREDCLELLALYSDVSRANPAARFPAPPHWSLQRPTLSNISLVHVAGYSRGELHFVGFFSEEDWRAVRSL